MKNDNKIKIAIFDLDGTLCRSDTFKAYLNLRLLKNPGLWHKIFPVAWWSFSSLVLRRTSNNDLKRNTLDLICRNINQSQAEADAQELIDSVKWDEKTVKVLEDCTQQGLETVLATASPEIYVRAIQLHFNIGHLIATEMHRSSQGIWTGSMKGRNCRGEEKARRISAWLDDHGKNWEHVMMVSDSHVDLPSLKCSALAYAVRPTNALKKAMSSLDIRPLAELDGLP